nr:MAG TPA: hypothetical protein [Bacteriophage sp.]
MGRESFRALSTFLFFFIIDGLYGGDHERI